MRDMKVWVRIEDNQAVFEGVAKHLAQARKEGYTWAGFALVPTDPTPFAATQKTPDWFCTVVYPYLGAASPIYTGDS